MLFVQSSSLIANRNDQITLGALKFQFDLLLGIVGIAVQHGVDCRLAHGHGNLHDLIFAKPALGGDAVRGLLRAVHGLQRRIQFVGEPVSAHKKRFQ